MIMGGSVLFFLVVGNFGLLSEVNFPNFLVKFFVFVKKELVGCSKDELHRSLEWQEKFATKDTIRHNKTPLGP